MLSAWTDSTIEGHYMSTESVPPVADNAATADVGNLTLAVVLAIPRSRDADQRNVYRWWITNNDSGVTVSGQDLSDPFDADSEKMLPVLASFMGADAESYRALMYRASTPDDGYLFGDDVAEWCYMNEDELSMFVAISEESE